MLLARCGLPSRAGSLPTGMSRSTRLRAGGAAVKAQMLAGATRQASGVRSQPSPTSRDVFATMADRLRAGGSPPHVLIEEKVAVETECYLAWRIDDVRQAPVLLFSRAWRRRDRGPGAAARVRLGPAAITAPVSTSCSSCWMPGQPRRSVGALARFADRALPPVRRRGRRARRDQPGRRHRERPGRSRSTSSGARRQRSLPPPRLERLAVRAASSDRHDIARSERRGPRLTLVELDGCVALFAGGAGFGMALVDLLARRRPAGGQFRRRVRRRERRSLRRHGRRDHGAGGARPTSRRSCATR